MEIILKWFLLLMRYFLNPIVKCLMKMYFYKSDRKFYLPKIKHDFLLLPAHKLAEKIRNKELTCVEVIEAYIQRIEEIQPILNCVVANRFKDAIDDAKEIDKILKSDYLPEEFNKTKAPLLGVPFSCKECFWVKDMPCATGVVARKDYRASQDADIVRNMRKAGAILLCVTTTSELCIWIESRSILYGVTKNPYNLTRIVGGSSGGEGCLISAGGSVIGIGSDIGGSIRIPSFFNGIYGHKSSYGLISNNVQYPPVIGEYKSKMLSSGPMCRYASDLRLLFKIHAGDLYTRNSENFESKINLEDLNYYVIENFDECFHASSLSKECYDGLKKAVEFIEKSFNKKVIKLDSKIMKDAFNVWVAHMRNGKNISLDINKEIETYSNKKFNPFFELIKMIFGLSEHTLHAIIYCLVERDPLIESEKYIKIGIELREYFNKLLGNNSILLSPGFPSTAPYHNQPLLTNTFDFIYFGIYNVLGLPSTQCPIGLCPESGLPIGIQFVSNDKCDNLTISLAEYFEKNLIGWVPNF